MDFRDFLFIALILVNIGLIITQRLIIAELEDENDELRKGDKDEK